MRIWDTVRRLWGSTASGPEPTPVQERVSGPGPVTPTAANAGAPRTLFVPESVVIDSWRALRATAEAGCEGVVMWAGPRHQHGLDVQVVTTVLTPAQEVSPGRYHIPYESVRQMGVSLRQRGLVNLAQLHTHPGRPVTHSPYDDENAFSSQEGAVSIVWPSYGREVPALGDWGVHERRSGRWVRLGLDEAQARITLIPPVVDLRITLARLPTFDHE